MSAKRDMGSSSHWELIMAQGQETNGDNLEMSFRYSINKIQSNLNSSNTDGSFTMANSNSFLSPYEIRPPAQENKYIGKFSYFIMKLYVVCTH